MKHLNQYKNDSFDLKALPLYITEYIIKKKLDTPIDSEDHYECYPKTKQELIDNIKELFDKGETNLNCIDTSKITDMSNLFNEVKDIHKFNFDVSRWDVSNIKDMTCMFGNCVKFKGKGLENWNVSKAEYMIRMFIGCDNFTGEQIENWKIKKDCSKFEMLSNCKNIKNMPSWYKE